MGAKKIFCGCLIRLPCRQNGHPLCFANNKLMSYRNANHLRSLKIEQNAITGLKDYPKQPLCISDNPNSDQICREARQPKQKN